MFKDKALNKILQIYYNCNNFRKVCWYSHSIKEIIVKNFALITTVNQKLFFQILLLTAPITYLPWQALRWIFISFCAMSHLVLSVYSSSGSPHLHFCPSLAVFFISSLWGTVTSFPVTASPWSHLPSHPHPGSHLDILLKFTWAAAKSFSLSLNWAEN